MEGRLKSNLQRRIADEKRRKAKAKLIVKEWCCGHPVTDRAVGVCYSTHGKPCSCESCRNPRNSKWNKGKTRLTMQERKAGEYYQSVIKA